MGLAHRVLRRIHLWEESLSDEQRALVHEYLRAAKAWARIGDPGIAIEYWVAAHALLAPPQP